VEVFGPDLQKRGTVEAGRHPAACCSILTARASSPHRRQTDSIAVIDTASLKVIRKLVDAAPGGTIRGSTPNALALSADEKRLFVAEADGKRGRRLRRCVGQAASTRADGVVSTALAVAGGNVIVVSGKGGGTAAEPEAPAARSARQSRPRHPRAVGRV